MKNAEAIRVLTENRPSLIFEDEEVQKRMADLCKAIDTAIEALQIEVVRCKNCKHYGETDCQIQKSFYGIKDFDFCSYGERKGG